jgi:imidazolonepropionase-like amidohydrolase
MKSLAGRAADFLVFDANPLNDIRNMRRIARVYQGRRARSRGASWTMDQ